MGTIVNKTIQEATARLKENYEAQKIFDMSLGDCVPNRDAIISIIEGLRTVTFPGFFGSENMAYVSKDNFAGSTLAILYERLFKQVRVALKFDNKELAEIFINYMLSEEPAVANAEYTYYASPNSAVYTSTDYIDEMGEEAMAVLYPELGNFSSEYNTYAYRNLDADMLDYLNTLWENVKIN